MSRREIATVAATACVIAWSGCSGDDSSGDAGANASTPAAAEAPFKARVAIHDSGYRPTRVQVLVGGSVTWVNRDPNGSHTAQTDPDLDPTGSGGEQVAFDTHTLTWGEPYTVTFHKPGMYDYFCSLDSTMHGTVEVVSRMPPP